MKGKHGEECNRTACQSPLSAYFYNTSTRAWYCRRCAEMIQAAAFMYGEAPLFLEPDLGVTPENYWRYNP